jgi:hypothetical protein
MLQWQRVSMQQRTPYGVRLTNHFPNKTELNEPPFCSMRLAQRSENPASFAISRGQNDGIMIGPREFSQTHQNATWNSATTYERGHPAPKNKTQKSSSATPI